MFRAGATAYFNIQEEETPGEGWNMTVDYNESTTTPGTGLVTDTGTEFQYPEEEWFLNQLIIDLDNDELEFRVNGIQVEVAYPYPGNLGAINFWSQNANNRYYIDDILFEALPPASVDVTFCVDLKLQVVAPEGVFLSGNFNGWPAPGIPMEDQGNHIWCVTTALPANSIHEYKFQNGNDGWEDINTPVWSPCTTGGFGNRFVEVGTDDVITDLICFNWCVVCELTSDVDNKMLAEGVSIFPNPANNFINIWLDLERPSEELNIRMINILGQVVYSQDLGRLQNERLKIEVGSLPTGVYQIHLTDGEAQFIEQIVIE